MRLEDWVNREGRGAISRLVRATGFAYTTVFRAYRGRTNLNGHTAAAISEATGGEVTVNELLGIAASGHDSSPPSAP